MMDWRKGAALWMGDSPVFHLSDETFTDDPFNRPLCHTNSAHEMYHGSITRAYSMGLRLCNKCRARYEKLWDRLRDIDDQVSSEDMPA